MKYLLFLTTLTVSPYLFSAGGDEQLPSPFMQAFDNNDDGLIMVQEAEAYFHDPKTFLDGYAALTLTTAFEKSGMASYDLAERLLDKTKDQQHINYEQSKLAGLLLLNRSASKGNLSAQRFSDQLEIAGISIPTSEKELGAFERIVLQLKKHTTSTIFFAFIDSLHTQKNPLAQLQQLAFAYFADEKFKTPETANKKLAVIQSIVDQKRSHHLPNRIFHLDDDYQATIK